jgi:hypothetical protein
MQGGFMKFVKITTENVHAVIEVKPPLYKGLQETVGGYIEVVRPKGLKHPFCMIVDEEGLLKKKPLNTVGSYLYGSHEHGHPIVGDVVIAKEIETHQGLNLGGLSEVECGGIIDEISKLSNTV